MSMNKWAIQRVFDINLFDLSSGQCYTVMNELKNTTFSQEGTTVYSMGGAGNPKIIGFDHSKSAKFVVTSATFDMGAFGVQLGSTPVIGATTVPYSETLTVTSNTATTTFTPVGTAGSEVAFAYVLNTDGSFSSVLTQAATPISTKFSVATKTLTFFTAELPDNTKVFVSYNATTPATAEKISSYTDLFAKNVKLVANGLVRDICTGLDYNAVIILYKAKASNNFEFAVTADGEPAVRNIEFEALKNCGDTKLWDMIVYTTTGMA